MEVFEAIITRRSIRKYSQKPVEWDKIITIIEAGKLAPLAGNVQAMKYVIVKEEGIRKQIAEACLDQTWMTEAPVHILIFSEPEKVKRFYGTRGERIYDVQNCAAAIENILLVAHSLGLGTCWVGAFDENKIRHIQNLPESIVLHAVVTLGYAAETPVMPPKYRIEHMTFIERWGQRKKIGYSSMGWWSVRLEKAMKDAQTAVKKGVEAFKKGGK